MSIKLWLCMACRAPSSPPTPPLYLQKKTPGQVFAPALKEREQGCHLFISTIKQDHVQFFNKIRPDRHSFGQLEIKLTS